MSGRAGERGREREREKVSLTIHPNIPHIIVMSIPKNASRYRSPDVENERREKGGEGRKKRRERREKGGEGRKKRREGVGRGGRREERGREKKRETDR